MNSKPTLKEISSMTGMSMATISRALSSPQKVKYATRLKIETAIKDLQNLNKSERKGIIGIIVPDISNQFFPLMLNGVNSIASDNNNTIMLCPTNGKLATEERALRKLLDIKVDGIIYITAGEIPPILKEITENDLIPIVFLDRKPGLQGINLITTDNTNGMYQATKYLMTLGHNRILYLRGHQGASTDNERLDGFKEAIATHDAMVVKIISGEFSEAVAFDAIKKLLHEGLFNYTAIISANDMMAIGAIKALTMNGLKVPEDVSVIGFDDIPSASTAGLTTVKQPFIEMGRAAIMQLIASIAEFDVPKKTTVLPSSIVFRSSCAIPKNMRNI